MSFVLLNFLLLFIHVQHTHTSFSHCARLLNNIIINNQTLDVPSSIHTIVINICLIDREQENLMKEINKLFPFTCISWI